MRAETWDTVWQDPAAHRHPSWQHGTLWGWAWHIVIVMAWQKLHGLSVWDCNWGLQLLWHNYGLACTICSSMRSMTTWWLGQPFIADAIRAFASIQFMPTTKWMICMLFLLAYLLVNRFVGVPCPDMTKLWMKFEAMNDRGDGTDYIKLHIYIIIYIITYIIYNYNYKYILYVYIIYIIRVYIYSI